MSRSYRHTSIAGITTAPSDQWSKRRAQQVWRQASLVALRRGDEVLPHLREVSSVWLMPKDGKHWFNAEKYPKGMRK